MTHHDAKSTRAARRIVGYAITDNPVDLIDSSIAVLEAVRLMFERTGQMEISQRAGYGIDTILSAAVETLEAACDGVALDAAEAANRAEAEYERGRKDGRRFAFDAIRAVYPNADVQAAIFGEPVCHED